MCLYQVGTTVSGDINPNVIGILNAVAVWDIKLAFFGGEAPSIRKHLSRFDDLYDAKGNMLEFTAGLDDARLRIAVLRSAEVVCYAHSNGLIHGNLSPRSFHVTGDSIMLLDIGLYYQVQQTEERIYWSHAHNYKARTELEMDPVVPVVAMDLHAWAKTVISLYSRSIFKPSLARHVSTATKPQGMPEDIWQVIVQCLDEGLNIQVDMRRIVEQLEAMGG